MDIKYYTPYLEAGRWNFWLPAHQRTAGTGSETWIQLPEGVHNIQIIWEGDKAGRLRFRNNGTTGVGRVIKQYPTVDKRPDLVTIVVPPGGAQIMLDTITATTASEAAPDKLIHAGVTVFLGTNEPPA